MTQQVLKNEDIWTPGAVFDSVIEDRIVYATSRGLLFKGDIQKLLPHMRNESIDTVFADPPFNLSKVYGDRVNDNRSDDEYLSWCKKWLDHCIRVVKPGGHFCLQFSEVEHPSGQLPDRVRHDVSPLVCTPNGTLMVSSFLN